MQVEKEEILHIANLASLNIKEEEIEEYRRNLQDILNFANIVNSVNTENVSETIGSTSNRCINNDCNTNPKNTSYVNRWCKRYVCNI